MGDMPGGPHTKLTPELIAKAQSYVMQRADFDDPLLPTIEGLSMAVLVHVSTIFAWLSELDPPKDGEDDSRALIHTMPGRRELLLQLSEVIVWLETAQKEKLVQNSLRKRYSEKTAHMILARHHGYGLEDKRRQQATPATDEGIFETNELTVEIVDAQIETEPEASDSL